MFTYTDPVTSLLEFFTKDIEMRARVICKYVYHKITYTMQQ